MTTQDWKLSNWKISCYPKVQNRGAEGREELSKCNILFNPAVEANERRECYTGVGRYIPSKIHMMDHIEVVENDKYVKSQGFWMFIWVKDLLHHSLPTLRPMSGTGARLRTIHFEGTSVSTPKWTQRPSPQQDQGPQLLYAGEWWKIFRYLCLGRLPSLCYVQCRQETDVAKWILIYEKLPIRIYHCCLVCY